jgi:diamine N-acetyltransferase
MTPRLETITPDNVVAACRVTVRPDQQDVVSPVSWSLAEAYANPTTAWPRLILDGDKAVGFVMAGFDPDGPVDAFRCAVWRLNIAADAQGRGYGRFAIEAVSAEARSRGQRRLTVLWLPHEHGPEQFYLKLGFRPTGEVIENEIVGELLLAD